MHWTITQPRLWSSWPSTNCNARKAKESNPSCQVQVKRRTDDELPKIHVIVVNGIEEVFDADATSTPTQTIGTMILEKGQMLQTESMFGEAGESRPIFIPDNKLQQLMHGTK
ncbi:hypothetical protein UlMin_008632, partial [Ulmus minor]